MPSKLHEVVFEFSDGLLGLLLLLVLLEVISPREECIIRARGLLRLLLRKFGL